MDEVSIFHQWSLESGQEEECGSATEGPGWSALFIGPFTPREIAAAGRDLGAPVPAELRNRIMRMGGAILYCATDGSYALDPFDSASDARAHWETVQADLEGAEYADEPGDSDPDHGEEFTESYRGRIALDRWAERNMG